MKKSALKKSLLLGIMFWNSIMVGLVSCGQKQLLAQKEKECVHETSINGELRWKEGFCWNYIPQGESTDGERIGFFMQERDQIEVFHDILSEEDFFVRINKDARELEERCPEKIVSYIINISARIDQVVQLNAKEEHRLYLRKGDDVYVLCGEMDNRKWRDFLDELLLTYDFRWNGSVVMEEGGTVPDMDTSPERKGIWRSMQYGNENISILGEVLLCHRQEEGIYFKTEYEDVAEEVTFRLADISLEYDNWEEAVSHFTSRCPNMYRMEVGFYGEENLLWDFEEKTFDQVFYTVEEPEGDHGFFLWNNKVYEVFSRRSPDYYSYFDMVEMLGSGYHTYFIWRKAEDGGIAYEDMLEKEYSYIINMENEEAIRLQAKIIEREGDGLWDRVTYGIEIFDEENRLLQEIQEDSLFYPTSPIGYGDINADGYTDLSVRYYDRIIEDYIFSPSQGKFVKLNSEINYGDAYWLDYETRKIYVVDFDAFYCGGAWTYQWKGEMDYELIKQIDESQGDDGIRVKVSRYENGKEELLSDYVYSKEEYEERDDIWGTYYEDFLWEKEVTDQTTGQKYIIRYAEVFLPEEAEKNDGIYYDGRIYVYDEDTYLIRMTHSEMVSESESIAWEDGSKGKEQALVICYADGGRSEYSLSGLIQPEYEKFSRL